MKDFVEYCKENEGDLVGGKLDADDLISFEDMQKYWDEYIKLFIPVVGSSLPKVCKGCGSLSNKVIDKKYLACCPDSNYIPMEEYCKKAIYPNKQF